MSAIHILGFYCDVGFACALDKPFKAKYEPEGNRSAIPVPVPWMAHWNQDGRMSSTFKSSSCHDRPPQSFPLHLLEALSSGIVINPVVWHGFLAVQSNHIQPHQNNIKTQKTRIRSKRVQITAPPLLCLQTCFRVSRQFKRNGLYGAKLDLGM